MTLSRNGIAYKFDTSPYELKVRYHDFNLIFRFSSENNIKKFLTKQDSNREKLQISLTKRFKINLSLDLIADLKLYSQVETRGFLILSKDMRFECLEEVVFDGQNLTKKNLQD